METEDRDKNVSKPSFLNVYFLFILFCSAYCFRKLSGALLTQLTE